MKFAFLRNINKFSLNWDINTIEAVKMKKKLCGGELAKG